MSRFKQSLLALVAGAAFSGMSVSALAQDQGNDRPDRGGDRGAERGGDRGGDRGDRGDRRGNFDPEQMRQRMMDRMKEQLGVTNDDEWKVLSPRLEKVMATSREVRGGGGMGFMFGGGGPGGRRGGDDNAPQTAVSKASRDLRAAVEDKGTSADELAKRVAALRDARQKARADHEQAEKDLKEVLTQRQEAQLVMAGMLD